MCTFAYSLSRGTCVLCAFLKHIISHKDLLRVATSRNPAHTLILLGLIWVQAV